eukprot:COSAG02_NODE_41381_length_395_cov_0.783784_1_plen_53_part_10
MGLKDRSLYVKQMHCETVPETLCNDDMYHLYLQLLITGTLRIVAREENPSTAS